MKKYILILIFGVLSIGLYAQHGMYESPDTVANLEADGYKKMRDNANFNVLRNIIDRDSLALIGDSLAAHNTRILALVGGGDGSVTSVSAGNGLDFTTITATGAVTLGTPSTTNLSSTNAATSTSHTHELSLTGFTGLTSIVTTGIITNGTWRGTAVENAYVTNTLTGKSVNGVTLSNGGLATAYLDETGAYSIPSGSGSGDLLADGTIPLTANWNVGAYNITASTFVGALTGNVTGDVSGNAGTVTTNANLTGEVTSVGNAASITANAVDDTHIDWGTGAGQVSAVDVPIADAGAIITATETEGALQENRTAINLNTAKMTNATHTSEVTGSGALTIADDIIEAVNLESTNSPSDNEYPSYDAASGGFTWGTPGGSGDLISTNNLDDVASAATSRTNLDVYSKAEVSAIAQDTLDAAIAAGVTGLTADNNLSDVASAATSRTNLGVDVAGTDNSTDVTLAGSYDYLTMTDQAITRGQIDLTTDVTGVLPDANVANDITITNISQVADITASAAEINTPLDGASVTLTEFRELETIGDNTISADQWAGLGGASTFGISLWDDADAAAVRTTLAAAPLASPAFTGTVTAATITATGNVSGAMATTLYTAATESLTAQECRNQGHVNNDADPIDFTLPTAEAGMVVLFYDFGGGVITVDAAAGDVITLDGTALDAADEINSPGDVGDFIALWAIDATNWVSVGRSGTWVDGGTD